MGDSYSQEYQRLNSQQKKAVDTIEGPVMVIAGAGTGKTQTIALRIGKILKETQVNPSNILCLTFTENAALNMRERLISLIGPTAYSVRIATFHAFCNSIIKDHPEYFLTTTTESEAIDDVTKIEIVRALIDSLPTTSPFKNIAAPYLYQKDILGAISTLKKENISPARLDELLQDTIDFATITQPFLQTVQSLRASQKTENDIVNAIKTAADFLHSQPLYQIRLNYFLDLFKQGHLSLSDLKKDFKKFVEKYTGILDKIRDLSLIYKQYQQTLSTRGFYDYEDMILWVITALKTHPELLSTYQETYHYLLVDEFQDTNSSQMEILNLLTQDSPRPNIFVVGDDDQSIFRFQGASIENIYKFHEKYKKDLNLIVLKNNYRSHQLILDSSTDVINHNHSRISQYIDNIDKSLTATKDYDPNPINLFTANNSLEENYWIADQIKQLVDSGVTPKNIAVLYRKNTDVNDLLPFLTQHNLLYLRSDAINILETLKIKQLLTLFKYLSDPQNDSCLGELLSFNFLGCDSLHLYKLFRRVAKEQLKLSEAILEDPIFDDFNQQVADTLKDVHNLPADELFNLIIRRFHFLDYVLKSKNLSLLKQLNTLYSHLKQSLLVDKISLFDWVQKIALLSENELSLDASALQSDVDNSLRLMTVHKAKGLEFEHVFIIRTLSSRWDDSRAGRSLITLPLGILQYDLDNDILEEDRRLFYVALTRAEKQIYLSYTRFSETGKEQLATRFIKEIDSQRIEIIPSTPEIEKKSLEFSFTQNVPQLKSVDLSSYLSHYLSTQYRFNITHLNSYLKCPLCFFFKTILRLPSPKAKSLSFGTAVHGALAYLTQIYKQKNQLISLDKFLFIFESNLKRENLSDQDFIDLQNHGRQVLTDYYHHYQDSFNGRCLTEHDFRFKNVHLGDIPLTGKIDKIEFLSGNQVNVVDYKTGKPDSKGPQLSRTGDYFRQLVFYKLLCDEAKSFPYQVVSGTIDFIEKNKAGIFVRKNYPLTTQDAADLKKQIEAVFQKILALDFTPNPSCDDKSHLHYLFDEYFK